jgi:LacI family transcriptional regulator
MKTRITIKDVARDAGVSVSTVSNWLRGQEYGLATATRDRVEASARRLGYRPSVLARGLRGQATRVVGLIVPSVTNPSMPPIIRGAEDRASETGYSLFLSNIDRHWEKAVTHSQAMADRGVEAVGFAFSVPALDAPAARAASDAGVRIAALLPADRDLPANVVGLDNEGAMRQVVDHLWALGHRRIGFATNARVTTNGPRRLAGLGAALASRGAALREDDTHLDPMQGSFDTWAEIESGRRAGLTLLSRADRPTAICAVNDLLAIGLILAAGDLGIRVPRELSVVGFDDLVEARIVSPALTTVHVPLYDLGRMLAERLLAIEPTAGVRVTPTLVVRGSSGPAARGQGSATAGSAPTGPDHPTRASR